jgi:transposase
VDNLFINQVLLFSTATRLTFSPRFILFKQLGFTLQRPRKMPVGADPEKQEAFKKN